MLAVCFSVKDPAFPSTCSTSSGCSSAEKRMKPRAAHEGLEGCAGAASCRLAPPERQLGLGQSGSVYTMELTSATNQGLSPPPPCPHSKSWSSTYQHTLVGPHGGPFWGAALEGALACFFLWFSGLCTEPALLPQAADPSVRGFRCRHGLL